MSEPFRIADKDVREFGKRPKQYERIIKAMSYLEEKSIWEGFYGRLAK